MIGGGIFVEFLEKYTKARIIGKRLQITKKMDTQIKKRRKWENKNVTNNRDLWEITLQC